MGLVLNLDGLVGPSHHYAGLSAGNLASTQHKGNRSSPRRAALQGLEKMWFLHQLGVPQGFIPPQIRPDLDLLLAAGFTGSPQQLIEQAYRHAPLLLHSCYSSSSMWTANCATVTASQDSSQGKVHFTPANLISTLHRSREAQHNYKQLSSVFSDDQHFQIHLPLPPQAGFADEGAANHIRLCDPITGASLNLFIYGKDNKNSPPTQRFSSRQSLLACQSIIRHHHLNPKHCLLIQQNPAAIDQGAFHNDVVSVGLNNVLLIHEHAWLNQVHVLKKLQHLTQQWGHPLVIMQIDNNRLTLNEAIRSYLFNSQLVMLPKGGMALIAPEESRESKATYEVIRQLLDAENPLTDVHFLDLRESMQNGGGPACLRLAIPLSNEELRAVDQTFILDESRYAQLKSWINKYYRDTLTPDDLRDPLLIGENKKAHRALIKHLR